MQADTVNNNVHELPETPTMADIEAHTKNFSDARQKIVDRIQLINDECDAIKRKHMRYLKAEVAAAKEKQSILEEALDRAKELFDKPKTQIFHAIKVGFRKAVGKLDWDDDEKVCDRIKANFPKQYDTLVKTTRKPIDKALKNLKADDLLKLGVTLGNDTDEITISSVDTEVDKIVNAFLKDTEPND